jgi:GyrI-like small molecule binding domain
MAVALLDRARTGAPVIQVRHLTAWPTAVLRGEVRPESVGRWVAHAHALVHAALAGRPAAGPPFARFMGGLTIEAGYPVPVAVPDLGEITASGLPEGLALVATCLGPDGVLEAAYDALDGWLAGHGYLDSGPHWEVYLPDRTEVVVPFREA